MPATPADRPPRTLTASAADRCYPDDPKPRDGAPDVVVIVLDDLGFAQIGAFGSDIATPTWTGSPRAACATTAST
ncbi:hypothetical protein ACU686_32905 [Yinghuangia aomiensis]